MHKQEQYDKSKLTDNPWATSLKVEVTKNTDAKTFTVGQPDDEGNVFNPQSTYYTERLQHVRIFYTKGLKDIMKSLSSKSRDLLSYIILRLDRNCDFVQINHEHYMAEYGISSINTFKAARTELLEAKLIQKALDYKTVYWINPNYFFPGNRVKKYPGCYPKEPKHQREPNKD